MTPKLKKKDASRNKEKTDSDDDVVDLNIDDALGSPADAKDTDFDLDLDASTYQGKKGQAGNRQTSD